MDSNSHMPSNFGILKGKFKSWFKSTRLSHRPTPEPYISSSSEVMPLGRSRLTKSARASTASRPMSTDASFLASSVPEMQQHHTLSLSGFRRSLSCERFKRTEENKLATSMQHKDQVMMCATAATSKEQIHLLQKDASVANKENVSPRFQRKSILKSVSSSSGCLSEHPSSSSDVKSRSSHNVKGHITFEDEDKSIPRASTSFGHNALPPSLSRSMSRISKMSCMKSTTDSSFTRTYPIYQNTTNNENVVREYPSFDIATSLIKAKVPEDSYNATRQKCSCTFQYYESQTKIPVPVNNQSSTIKTLCSECQVRLKQKTSHAVRTRILTERRKRRNILHYIEPDMSTSRLLLNRLLRLKDDYEENAVLADDECSVACSCYQCMAWNPTDNKNRHGLSFRNPDSTIIKSSHMSVDASNGKLKVPNTNHKSARWQCCTRDSKRSVQQCKIKCENSQPTSFCNENLPLKDPDEIRTHKLEKKLTIPASAEHSQACETMLSFQKLNRNVQPHSIIHDSVSGSISVYEENLSSVPNNNSISNSDNSNDISKMATPKSEECLSTWYENIEEDIMQSLRGKGFSNFCYKNSLTSLADSPSFNRSTLSKLVEMAVKRSIEHLLSANVLPILRSPLRSCSLDELRNINNGIKSIDGLRLTNNSQSFEESKAFYENVPIIPIPEFIKSSKPDEDPLYENIWDFCSGQFGSLPDLRKCKELDFENLKRPLSLDCLSLEKKNPSVKKSLKENSNHEDALRFTSESVPLQDGNQDGLQLEASAIQNSTGGCEAVSFAAENSTVDSLENSELIKELGHLGKGFANASRKTPTKKIKFKAKDVLSGKAKLKLAVYKNGSLLTVHVIKAASLSSKRSRCVNSYVKVSLHPDDLKRTNWRTNVIQGTNCPSFHQIFSFELLPEDAEKRILISVWHRDLINRRSEFLGCMTFGVNSIISNMQCIRGWYRLLNENIGTKKHFATRK